MAIKIFTRTKHTKVNNKYVAKMFGAIEGPIHQMMLKFPNEF